LFLFIHLGYPSGLINYGNNCFANAIVQCLASSSIFIRWIENHLENNTLAKILLDLIKSINGQSLSYSHESTVATLIDHMRQPRWLTPFEQQDSHEFLLSLINSLTSPQVIQSKQLGFAACLDSDEEDISKSMMIKESPLITPHPFQGLQATQLQCMECKHKVNNLEISLIDLIYFFL
jgi:ubiquitin C-terminal hydrolase